MDLQALAALRRQAYGRMMGQLKKGAPGQPEVDMVEQQDGSIVPRVPFVYVTSVESLKNDIRPGAVVSALPNIAANLITEGSHRLSTEEEINKFHKLQVDNKIEANARDLAATTTSRTVIVNGSSADAALPLELPEHLRKFAPVAPAKKGAQKEN